MKQLRNLLCLLALVLALTISASAADGVTVTTATIGGSTAQVVYVDLIDGRAVVPVIANNSMSTDAPASSVISSVKTGSVVAAVNGGFFDSYYNAGAPLSVATDNYPRVYATIYSEGRVINAGGQVAAIGIDYDGNVAVGRVTVQPTLTINGQTVVNIWGANTISSDASAVYSLTDNFDYPVNIPATSKVVVVKDNKVISITDGASNYVTADGTVTVVYNSAAWANAVQWEVQPWVGAAALYSATITASTDQEIWSDARNIIGGGGLLVQDGVSMVDTNTSVTAADQQPDVVGQRTFVALTADGRLMLGTVSSSFRSIANSLIAMGITDAIYMDGGASSMLYANGSYLTTAGRELAVVMAVVDETSAPVRPDNTVDVDVPAPVVDEPSAWAVDSINAARSAGILPEHLDSKYLQNITRKEFCDLIATYFRAETGFSIEYYCSSNGITVNTAQFSDSSDYYVPYVAALGIVTGYPDGTFHPKDSIKRQDAAIMLQRLAQLLEMNSTGTPKTFTDGSSISPYAVPGVDFVTSLGIMNGNADGTFSPAKNITREQAVITIMNMYSL
jgi:hypothetical protein